MDGQNFDPRFGKSQDPFAVKVTAPEVKVELPKVEFDLNSFEDEGIKRAREDGAVQFASGVVRVSDAPTYNLPEVNKSLYGEKLGVTRANELRAAVGLKANESFTEYYNTNKFVPTGFDIDAKILLREEKIKKLEQDVASGKLGYQTFLYKAYGQDLLKADGHDMTSSLYWYNRRKQGMYDSPIDNPSYLASLLQQAQTLYQNEVWYAESNTLDIQNSFLGQLGDKNKLPPLKVRELFEEQFKQLDTIVESDEEKIKLYKAGLLRGFNPTVDVDGDGKIDYYLHRDGMLYKVREAGSDAPDTKAISYYNEDGSLDRIEVDGMFGVYGDQVVQGALSAVAGVADLFMYGTVGLVDTIENLFTGNWEYDKLADLYVEVEGAKAGSYMFGNNVYSTGTGFTKADGSIDFEGIGRGTSRAVGYLAGMFALSAIGGGLSGVGTKEVVLGISKEGQKILGKEVVKYGGLKGFTTWGLRNIGNAINGVVGLSQGVYRAGTSNAVLTATQATVRGLGYLAVKDFTTTTASLTASKEFLDLDDNEIIGSALAMTGLNFGLSFLLRSVGDTPATTRLANWWKSTFQKSADIKAAGALDDTFADSLLRWAADASKRKSFVFTNSAMDMMENFLTMGTQSSLATTGKMFDKQAWLNLLDPQNLVTQGWLFKNNLMGGFRGNDMQMGAGGIAAQVGNLNRIYSSDIVGKMLEISTQKAASKNDADIKAAETISLAVKEANRIRDTEKNPALGIQKAMNYLHNTFKDDNDMSFVRDAIIGKYNESRLNEIILGTKAAIETFTSVVANKLAIEKDALLKGDIFGPDSHVSKTYDVKKLKSIEKVVNDFEGAMANLAKFKLVDNARAFESLKKVTVPSLIKNKENFIKLGQAGGLDKGLIDLEHLQITNIKTKDASGKEVEVPQFKLGGEVLSDDLVKLLMPYVGQIGKGKANNLAKFTLIDLPTDGSSEGQAARLKLVGLLNTLSEIAKVDSKAGMIQPIYQLRDGTYLIPAFHDGLKITTFKKLHEVLVGLYGVKYNTSSKEKSLSFKDLFLGIQGKAYTGSKEDNIVASGFLNKLINNNFISLLDASYILSGTEFAKLNSDPNINLNNLTGIKQAIDLNEGIRLYQDYKTKAGVDPNTRDQGVVDKARKAFEDYYTNLSPELQILIASREGFSAQELGKFIAQNPIEDKSRLLSFFKTLSENLGSKEAISEDKEFYDSVVNTVINLTGAQKVLTESLPEAVLSKLQNFAEIKVSGRNVNTVVAALLGKVKSTQDLRLKALDFTTEDIKLAIQEVRAKLVNADKSEWKDSDTLNLEQQIKTLVFKAKAEAITENLFYGNTNSFKNAILEIYNSKPAVSKEEQTKQGPKIGDVLPLGDKVEAIDEFTLENITKLEKLLGVDLSAVKLKLTSDYGNNAPVIEGYFLRGLNSAVDTVLFNLASIKTENQDLNNLNIKSPSVRLLLANLIYLKTATKVLFEELNKDVIFSKDKIDSMDKILKELQSKAFFSVEKDTYDFGSLLQEFLPTIRSYFNNARFEKTQQTEVAGAKIGGTFEINRNDRPILQKLIFSSLFDKTLLDVLTTGKDAILQRTEEVQPLVSKQKFETTPVNEKTYLPIQKDLKIISINGKQFLQSGDNFLAIVEYNGVRIPFYWSSGNNPKDGVTPERWYYTAGIYESGTKSWINKPSSEEIRNFGYSKIIRAMSEFLSDNITVPTSKEYGVRPSEEELAVYNEGLKPRRYIDFRSNQAKELYAKLTQEEKQRLQQQLDEPFNLIKPRIEALLKYESIVGTKQTETFTQAVAPTFKLKTKAVEVVVDTPKQELVKGVSRSTFDQNRKLQSLVLETVLGDPANVKKLFDLGDEKLHIQKAMDLYEKIFIKDTISQKSSGKIILNINELLGREQARFLQAAQSSNKRDQILSSTDTDSKLTQVFGEKFVSWAKLNLNSEMFTVENLVHLYKDRLVNGTLEFNFQLIDGRIRINSPEERVLLETILRGLNYELYDIGETLENIPGIYFKAQHEDNAVDIEFEKNGKALFLKALSDEGSVKWTDVAEDAYIKTLDLKESIINRTSNLNFIDDNTQFAFGAKDKKLPRFVGSTDFSISNKFLSIFNALDLNLKQGRNGGALFKAYFMARRLNHNASSIDINLKKNNFVMETIDAIDEFVSTSKKKVFEKTLVFSEMILSEDNIKEFKDNGDFYNFVYLKDYDDKSGRNLKIYQVVPKDNFKELAYDYINKNGTVNFRFILPLELSSKLSAQEQFNTRELNISQGDNIAVSNTSRLNTLQTTGYDMVNFIQTKIGVFSEEFIRDVYLDTVSFIKRGLGLESKIVDMLKNKTYKEIMTMGDTKVTGENVLLKDTIYYEMLNRFLLGARQLSDSIMKELGTENAELNKVLSDKDVRESLGDQLTILLDDIRKKTVTLDTADHPRINKIVTSVNKILNRKVLNNGFASVNNIQALGYGPESEGKAIVDSYEIASLGVNNKFKAKITNKDVFEIFNTMVYDQNFKILNATTKEGQINPVVSKIQSLISTADTTGEEKLSIFVDHLYRLDENEFDQIISFMKSKGVKASSLSSLKKKYKTILDNSVYHEAMFRNRTESDFYSEERLITLSNLPSATRRNVLTYFENDSEKSKKQLTDFLNNQMKKPVSSSSAAAKMIKASGVDIQKSNPYISLISNLKNAIEKDVDSPLTASRLVQNLQHSEFLGKYMFNIIELSKNVHKVMNAQNIKIGVEDATKIAFTILNQSTGVTYDKFFANTFFFDTKTNTIKSVTGSGASSDSFGYIAYQYIKDYVSAEPGRIIAFQVDKDALLSSSRSAVGSVRFMILDENNQRQMRTLVNQFVNNERNQKRLAELPPLKSNQEKFATVLSRYTTQADRYDMITTALTKLKIPHQYARSIARQIFFNGQNVQVGSPKDSFNYAKTMNTINLNNPNYRTSNIKENNVQKSLNDSVYFINVNELPSDYLRTLRVAADEFEKSLPKANGYRDDVLKVVDLIIEKGTKHIDVVNLMEAFKNKTLGRKSQAGDAIDLLTQSIFGNEFTLQKFTQDVMALYILKKNDGATHNFLLLDNNINDIMTRASQQNRLEFTTDNGKKYTSEELLRNDWFASDVESAFYIDKKGNEVPLVLEVSVGKYKGLPDIRKTSDNNEQLEGSIKRIVVPAYYEGKVINRASLALLTKLTDLDKQIEFLFPEYYAKVYKRFGDSARNVWNNYLDNVDSIVLNKTNGISKSPLTSGSYLVREFRKLGYDGTQVLISFNGKNFDFGSKEKDGVLIASGILPANDTFFKNSQVDIFSDIYVNQRFDVGSYSDQQGYALIDLARKLNINYENAHVSDSDVDVTAKAAVKLLAVTSNANRITTNILNVMDDLLSNLNVTRKDIPLETLVKNVPLLNKTFLSDDTNEFIKNYKEVFNPKNLTDFNKAVNTIISQLKDYLDTVEKEVKRKQIKELVREELGNRYNFFEKIQKNSNEIATVFEYFIERSEKFISSNKYDDNTLLDKTEDDYKNRPALLRIFDLLKEVFGDEIQGKVNPNEESNIDENGVVTQKPGKTLSAYGYERLLSLNPDQLFDLMAKQIPIKSFGFATGRTISKADFEDFKKTNNGSKLQNYIDQLRERDDNLLGKINNEEKRYSLLTKFTYNYDSLFGSVISGFDKSIQDIILNEAATPFLRNLGLSDSQYRNRINDKGLKLDDSNFIRTLKGLVNNSSFGSTFHYTAFYSQVNQADYNMKYEMANGNTESIGANEIGMTAKQYEDSTGISVENAKALFNVSQGGDIYLNVMRHPVDKIGSIASLKVKILADTPENRRTSFLMNTDTLFAVLAGDVDGDNISILSPTKGSAEFNSRLFKYLRKGNDLISRSILKLNSPKSIENDVVLKLTLKYGNQIFTNWINNKSKKDSDRFVLSKGKKSFDVLRSERKQELINWLSNDKADMKLIGEKDIDKIADDILKYTWLQEYDLNVFLVGAGKFYYTSNTQDNSEENLRAFKALSFAKTRNFGAQAIADTSTGYYANLKNRIAENFKGKDVKFLLNYSVAGLTEESQEYILANLSQFKQNLVSEITESFNRKELFINENDFKILLKGISDEKATVVDILSYLTKLDALIMESKEFGDEYVKSYQAFTELDKDILQEKENFNVGLLQNYAKTLGIEGVENIFDLSLLQNIVFEKLANYSKGNFWASSGSSAGRKEDLLRGLQKLEDLANKNLGEDVDSNIRYHESVAGITDEEGFRADIHSNIMVVFDKEMFQDSLPIKAQDVYLYNEDSLESLKSVKAFMYSVNSVDKKLVKILLDNKDEVLKNSITLSNGEVIPAGYKFINYEQLKDGSSKLLFVKTTDFEPGTKFIVPGTKNFKSTLGGAVKSETALGKVIKSFDKAVDFVYSSDGIDYKNFTPLVGKFFNKDNVTYYDRSNQETKDPSQAAYAIFKEVPMQLTQVGFETRRKTNNVDDIILSTSKRNIFGNVLFGNSLIKVDSNDPTKITFSSELISKGSKALDVLNQPTLIGNNAAYLHGSLINFIALKYSGLSQNEITLKFASYAKEFDLGSIDSIKNFWYIIDTYYNGSIQNLYPKLNDMEQIILSDNLYSTFFDSENGRIIKSIDEIKGLSKNEGFQRQVGGYNSVDGQFRPAGKNERLIARRLENTIFNNKYKGSLVFDNTFGYMSNLEYLNYIINAHNMSNKDKAGFKPISFIKSNDAVDASLLKILNVGMGVGSSLYDGFEAVNLRDALIETVPQNYGASFIDQKTGDIIEGIIQQVKTKNFAPSEFSEKRKPNDFQNTLSNYTNLIGSTNMQFDSDAKRYTNTQLKRLSSINTNKNSSTGTTLRQSEVRALKYILNSAAKAKNINERVALFGYNPKVYAPLSITGVAVNENDNRLSLGYDTEFVETSFGSFENDIKQKLNSRRFMDLFDFKSDSLEESLNKASQFDEITAQGKAFDYQERNKKMDEVMAKPSGVIEKTEGQNIWNNLFAEEVPSDHPYMKFKQKLSYDIDNDKITTVFEEDVLRSGLFKIVNTDSGLSIEVERAVRDYLVEPKVLLLQFSQPLKELHDFAASFGAVQKLNTYAASKFYIYAFQKIDTLLQSKDLKATDKQKLELLRNTYLEDFNDLKTGFEKPEQFMENFENNYGAIVSEFNNTNKYLGQQFRQYSVMTDEVSDNLFFLLKPTMRKKVMAEEKLFMRLSMFTPNNEGEYEKVDLSTYNYFDDTHKKLSILSKQAAVVRLSTKLKNLGLMANVPVKNHIIGIIRKEVLAEASKFEVKGGRSLDLIEDTNNFVKEIDDFLFSAYGLRKINTKDNINVGKIGIGLYNTYEILERFIAEKSEGVSREQAFVNLRSALPNSDESKKYSDLIKLYDYQNQVLIALTSKIDKDVLNAMYISLKAEADRNGTVLTDRFGRKLAEDPRDYKMLYDGSTEAVKHIVKFANYSGGFEKNIIIDALNGDVFFANKSLAESLDKNFFTQKMPNKILETIAKLNALTSKLIMSNPFRYLDRLIGFTAYDVATLGSFEPKTFLKLGSAINQVSAFLQSKFNVISPELAEFLAESGIDPKSSDFQEIFAGFSSEGFLDKIIDPIAKPLGKGFNVQNIIGRYSYWLAVKENLDNNKPINFGPAYNIKKAVDSLQAKVDEDGNTVVSQNGRKAYFLMSEILGAPGDFPILARKLKGLAMFTTFPLAAARFARGILGSGYTAVKEMLTGDNANMSLRWLASTSLGISGLFAVPWLIFELWGQAMGLSEEEKEEWKEEQGMPEFIRSIYTGSPVVNKFNTFNQYVLLDSMTVKPFRDAIEEGGSFFDGATRWFLDNVASRGPSPLKLTAEVLGGFDSFGGTITDTSNQYSMWENLQRKLGGYFLGGAGSNALTNYLNKDLPYMNQTFAEAFVHGFRVVVDAEMGNTTAFKSDIKNYYRANSIIQSARFANPQDVNYTSSAFNTEDYSDLKSDLSRAFRRKARPSVIYGMILDALNSGVGMPEVRSALRNNSLEYKLSQVPNLNEFYNQLSESEYKTINDAIAYERQTYPFLDDLIMEINNAYKQNNSNNYYTPRVYIPRVYAPRNYKTNYATNYSNFVRNSRYNDLFKVYAPASAYRASWYTINKIDESDNE